MLPHYKDITDPDGNVLAVHKRCEKEALRSFSPVTAQASDRPETSGNYSPEKSDE